MEGVRRQHLADLGERWLFDSDKYMSSNNALSLLIILPLQPGSEAKVKMSVGHSGTSLGASTCLACPRTTDVNEILRR